MSDRTEYLTLPMLRLISSKAQGRKPFFFNFVVLFAYFRVFGPFTMENCLIFRKLACPFRQVKTIMFLPESTFFSKIHLPGQVLMSVPAKIFSTGRTNDIRNQFPLPNLY